MDITLLSRDVTMTTESVHEDVILDTTVSEESNRTFMYMNIFKYKDEITIGLYTISTVFGTFFNVVIIHAFRNNKIPRNIIILHVCIADLLVCVLSSPSSVIILLQTNSWLLGSIPCKILYFIQSIPTVTSTMLLMMLSIDRYFTVRRPILFQTINQEDRLLQKIMVLTSWLVGILLCLPVLIVREALNETCYEKWIDPGLKTCYVVCYIVVLYLLPMAVVVKCHMSVGSGIFEAMANGDVPLPMPIQARNHELIIVAASVNDINPVNDPSASSSARRYFRRIFRSKKNRKRSGTLAPNNSLIKARRTMATMLVVMALVFALCWFPFVLVRLYLEFAKKENHGIVEELFPYSLFLGHFHSAINPFVYWYLNRQSIPLNLSFELLLPWNWGDERTNWFRKVAKYWAGNDDDRYSRSSTTNEAQLGAFHPRFTRPRRREEEDQV